MVREDPAALLLAALEARDPRRVRRALHPRVRLVIDAGGREGGVHRGRRRVVRELLALVADPRRSSRSARVNAMRGVAVVAADGTVVAVLAAGGRVGRIRELWAWTAPEKLRGWAPRPSGRDPPSAG